MDFGGLTLTQIIQLQNDLSAYLAQHFQKWKAIAFSDIVGSTLYFSQFGNEAGRRLHQRHIELITKSLVGSDGYIVDTAGDGAFLCFDDVVRAIEFSAKFHFMRVAQNLSLPSEHQLRTRTAVHWGAVLTDGAIVTGDPVNLCAKIVGATAPENIYISRAAFDELPATYRLRCEPIKGVQIPGVKEGLQLLSYSWADPNRNPTAIIIQETAERISLPSSSIITFGRLGDHRGIKANDIVLSHNDKALSRQISRWHFELRRTAEGCILHSVTDQPTEVGGVKILKGQDVPIFVGSTVRVSNVLTIRFISDIDGLALDSEAITMVS